MRIGVRPANTQPTIDALRAKYSSSVIVVEFDVTDAKTSAAAAAPAALAGLAAGIVMALWP